MSGPSSECVDFVAVVTGGGGGDDGWTARLDVGPRDGTGIAGVGPRDGTGVAGVGPRDGTGVEVHAESSKALWKRVAKRITHLAMADKRKSEVQCAALEMWVSDDGRTAQATRSPECRVRTWYVRAHVHAPDTRGRPRGAYHHHPAVRMLDDDLEVEFAPPGKQRRAQAP